ncbi:MAG TPA: hypothetical protein VFU11_13110 [Solirubrobacterales bacterium]|nr:hypothetical protein [Solirubrobacterales bacterium]
MASAAPEAGLGWSFKVSFLSQEGASLERAQNHVAVDASGNIYAGYSQNNLLPIYSPDPVTGGNLLVEVPLDYAARNIAVDGSGGAFYVDSYSEFTPPERIWRYVSDGSPTPTYTLDPGFEAPKGAGMAVDPTTSDLLVADPNGEAVQRYDTTGVLVETISTPGTAPAFIASLPDGSFLVASSAGPDVLHLSGSGIVLDTIADVGALRGLTWDETDNVVVAAVGATLKSYSLAGDLEGQSPAETDEGVGLAFDPGQDVLYQASRNPIYVYDQTIIPGVEDPVVSDITGKGAHLSAEVAPGEGPPAESKAHFEYSDDGGISWTSTPDQELNSEAVTEVSADITGLLANQEYLVRVKASNDKASKTSGIVSFPTAQIAPEVEATGASGIEETNAVLNGTVNPNGLQTTYYFEYGPTASYGSRVPLLVGGVAGADRVNRAFKQAISGLEPGTTYHYRLVAENAIGQSLSADEVFTTAGAGEIALDRRYEQVTPVDKGGAQVLSDFHVQVSDQGSAIAVSTASGATNSETAMIRQNFVVRRAAGGWEDWEPTDAPQDALPGIFESSTAAVSEDYKHALVASNRVLDEGGVEGAGNLYIKDLQAGSYTFVGSAPDGYGQLVGGNVSETVFAAGAPDFSWVLFWSDKPMIEGVSGRALYRWSQADGLTLESVTPSGAIPPSSLAVLPNGNYQLPPASADGTLTAFDPGFFFVFSPTFEVGGGVYIRRDGGPSTPIAISRMPGAEPVNATDSQLNWVTPDGRYVFFQTHSRLTEGAPEELGSADGVYRYDTETDELIYIGRKTGQFSFGFSRASDDGQTVYLYAGENQAGEEETTVWHEGVTHKVTQANTNLIQKYATPNGRYFAWVEGGKAFLYDRDTNEKACVSCTADGGAASAVHFGALGRNMGNQQGRAVTEDGTMFFDTKTALLSSDHNGSQDVYAYKDGHLTLISSGNADFDAVFVGASADGTDVYFQTDQGLVAQDTDGNSDVYDARVGGGFAEPLAPADCTGEGCRGAAGRAPQGSSLGSAANGADEAGQISGVKALTAAQRKTLARGGKVRLKLKILKAGTVKVTGKASGKRVISSSVKADTPGPVSVSLRLSKPGLSELAKGNSLTVKLTIAFDGQTEKAMTLAVKPVGKKKKGGDS